MRSVYLGFPPFRLLLYCRIIRPPLSQSLALKGKIKVVRDVMYRLRLISPLLGVDESGPLQTQLETARQVAVNLINVYQGKLKVEIRRVIDLRLKQSEWVETIAAWDYSAEQESLDAVLYPVM